MNFCSRSPRGERGLKYTRTGNGSIAHSPIAGSGAVSYSYTVTDSRGLARTYTGTLTVLAWRAPQIAGFAVERVTSANASAVDGTYARVTVQATASTLPVDGAQKNSLSYYVRYRQAGASAWTNGDTVSVSGGISVNQSFMLQKDGANVGTFDDLTGYDFQLVISDIYASSTASSSMPTKTIVQHVRKPNGSMGFGGEATGTGSTPQYDFYGPINAREGVSGFMRYTQAENDTGMRWYDGKPIYCRVFTGSTLTNSAGTTIGTISGVDALVRIDGHIRRAAEGDMFPANFAYYNNPQQMLGVKLGVNGEVVVYKGDAWNADGYEIAVLYTKT